MEDNSHCKYALETDFLGLKLLMLEAPSPEIPWNALPEWAAEICVTEKTSNNPKKLPLGTPRNRRIPARIHSSQGRFSAFWCLTNASFSLTLRASADNQNNPQRHSILRNGNMRGARCGRALYCFVWKRRTRFCNFTTIAQIGRASCRERV